MVQQHMKSANRNAAGPSLLSGKCQSQSAAQAAWRFLNNPNVSLVDLAQPLREVGRSKANQSESKYVLLAHDWCKLDYKRHESKKDLRQITHEHDIGYEMFSSLLIDGGNGSPIAPMQMHLKTSNRVHSTAHNKPKVNTHRLDQLTPTMKESSQWGLERNVVHVIDREADTLGRMRQWDAKGHLFLVRCDDRRVKWGGKSILLAEIADHFDSELLFESAGDALYRGKTVSQEVAQTEVVLNRQHSEVIDGEKTLVSGLPLTVRFVVTRLIDEDGYIVAQWMLLTNVFDEQVSAYQIALWYYWRWLIETFFKLLKSHGIEMEKWQQQNGQAIARRILVASMACVVAIDLQNDDSAEAVETRRILVRLSGRQMKHGCISTAPALLAGFMALLAVTDLLTQSDIDIGKLKQIAMKSVPQGFV